MSTPIMRNTKYCDAILALLPRLGHATNAQILEELRQTYPELSATTVHRATARLAERGKIAVGPADQRGSTRYDATITPHDHFECMHCGLLRDADIASKVTTILAESLEGCRPNGRLTITGTCWKCTQRKEEHI